jgi:hypothetical protein
MSLKKPLLILISIIPIVLFIFLIIDDFVYNDHENSNIEYKIFIENIIDELKIEYRYRKPRTESLVTIYESQPLLVVESLSNAIKSDDFANQGNGIYFLHKGVIETLYAIYEKTGTVAGTDSHRQKFQSLKTAKVFTDRIMKDDSSYKERLDTVLSFWTYI